MIAQWINSAADQFICCALLLGNTGRPLVC
jgi:hypothetical protein